MSAHQQTLDAIVSDIRDQGKSGARFATIHSFYLNTHSLKSVAVFDRQHSISSNEKVIVDGVALIADGLMSLSAEADWNRIEGESDDAKITQLLKAANSQLDYLIIPTAECSEFLKKNISHNVINRYVVSLREKIIESKNWEVISIDIANRSDEIVQVFRKTSPNLAIQSSKMVR